MDNDNANPEVVAAEKSPVITLPTDNPERVAQLTRKLAEYKGRQAKRLAGLGAAAAFMAPEVLGEAMGSTQYKVIVLERLLQDGQIETWALARELAEDMEGYYDPQAFSSACAVIEDYVTTGGANLVGSTGLK